MWNWLGIWLVLKCMYRRQEISHKIISDTSCKQKKKIRDTFSKYSFFKKKLNYNQQFIKNIIISFKIYVIFFGKNTNL